MRKAPKRGRAPRVKIEEAGRSQRKIRGDDVWRRSVSDEVWGRSVGDEVWRRSVATKCGDEVSLKRWLNTSSPGFVAHFVIYTSSNCFVGRSERRGEISKSKWRGRERLPKIFDPDSPSFLFRLSWKVRSERRRCRRRGPGGARGEARPDCGPQAAEYGDRFFLRRTRLSGFERE